MPTTFRKITLALLFLSFAQSEGVSQEEIAGVYIRDANMTMIPDDLNLSPQSIGRDSVFIPIEVIPQEYFDELIAEDEAFLLEFAPRTLFKATGIGADGSYQLEGHEPEVRESLISQSAEIEFPVPTLQRGTESRLFIRTELSSRESDASWRGMSENGNDSLQFQSAGTEFIGTLYTEGRVFEVSMESDNRDGALRELQNLPDHERGFEVGEISTLGGGDPLVAVEANSEIGQAQSLANSKLTVLILATDEAAISTGGARLKSLICSQMEEFKWAASLGLDTPLSVEAFISLEVFENPSDSVVESARLLSRRNSRLGASVNAMRATVSADLLVLLQTDTANCGFARGSPANSLKNSIAVVNVECALHYQSLQHELGHLFGACHDGDGRCSTARPTARGFISSTPWATIMGQRDSCNNCMRIGSFSDDEFTFRGERVGNERAQNLETIQASFAAVSEIGAALPVQTDPHGQGDVPSRCNLVVQ